MLTPSLKRIAVEALQSVFCACGKPKLKAQSLCIACYRALPFEMKRGLYRTFSEGYAERYDEAVEWLRQNGFMKQGSLFA